MKFGILILFIQIIYFINLVKSDTKSILIDNEEYICSSLHDHNSEISSTKNSTKSECKYNALNGYTLFSGKSFSGYYKYHKEPTLWVDAKVICESECAYLAIPNSKEEATFLTSLLEAYPTGSVKYKDELLIGFNDLVNEGHYVTVLGSPLNATGYTDWLPRNPNSAFAANEDCGSLNSGLINDYPCAVPATFICEKNKV